LSASVAIGLLLAVATALASIVGFLYKHRGAIERPDVEWRRPIWSSLMLFRSRWYTLGIVVAMAGWGLDRGQVGPPGGRPLRRLRQAAVGGIRHLDQGAQRRARRCKLDRDRLRPAGGGDRDRLLRGAPGLGP
jgi:hypothetical protein